MEFYQKLKVLRKQNGLSQEEFAAQLGVSRQAVSKWESGQGFPETEKLIQISTMFGVSLDYLLKAETTDADSTGEEPGYYASREMVESYLASKRQGSFHIAAGVAVIILSLIFVMITDHMWGTVLLLIGVAVGIAILLMQGFRPKRHIVMETQPLVFDTAYLKEFRSLYAQRRKQYGYLIVAGVLLIIISFALQVVLSVLFTTVDSRVDGILPVFWAVAVFLFIIAGSALGAEGMIANNAEHMAELEKGRRSGPVFAAVMPLTTMLYLAVGFLWGVWHPGWLLFPVAALVCVAITGIRNAR